MKLCFFDDDISSNFRPLTLTRPVSDLRIGLYTIREKWELHLKENTFCSLESNYIPPTNIGETSSESTFLWINSRFLPSEGIVDVLNEAHVSTSYTYEGKVIAFTAPGDTSAQFIEQGTIPDLNFSDSYEEIALPVEYCTSIEHLWDLLTLNASEIENDISLGEFSNIDQQRFPDVVISGSEHIYVGEGVKIEPGALLIASDGSIVIGNHVTIQAGSMIRGNVAIGDHATINMGAKIRSSTSIGPHCKVGGEVSNSIFHSYSNKGHDGFVGHSLIGQWVNLGADTNTSNLKNNYSSVRVVDWQSLEAVDSGQQFFGSVIGDHSKTSINTMLNTGTICGVNSNIFSSGFPPKYIPSFSWVGDGEIQEYRFDKAQEAMRAMMKRRDIEPSEAYLRMMKDIFENR